MEESRKIIEIIFEAFDKTSGVFKKLDKSIGRIEKSVGRLDKKLKEVDTSIQEVATAAASLGAAMAAPFVIGIKSSADFERAMAKVKAISGATAAEFRKLQETALHLGRVTTYTAVQATEGFQFLAMAGIKANDAIKALPSVLLLAKAGSIELGTAADITTNILTAYRFEVEDLAHVNDVLVKAFTSSNTNLMELGEGFKFVGPLARGLGSQFEDIIASMGKLADAGIKASVAGTTLRGTISALFNPTKEEEKLMGMLSIRIGDAGLQMRDSEGSFVGFGELIAQLEKAGIGADEALKLFGLRAGPGIAALLGIGSESIKQFTDELVKSDGVALKISEIMGQTLYASLTRLSSAFDGLTIAIGKPFLNSLALSADAMAGFLITLTTLHEALGPFATVIDTVAVSLGGLLVALGAVAVSSKFVIAPLIKFIRVIGAGGLFVAATNARIAITALGASLGPAGLAFLAAIGTYNIGRLVEALVHLRKEAKATAYAEKEIGDIAEKTSKRLSQLSKEFDIPIKNMDAFNKLVQKGQIVFEDASKKWILAGDSIKTTFDKTAASMKKMIEDAAEAMEGFGQASAEVSIATRKTMMELRWLVVNGVKTEKESIEALDKIRILDAEKRLHLANEVFEKVKKIYDGEKDEFKESLMLRQKAELALAEVRISIAEREKKERAKIAQDVVEQMKKEHAKDKKEKTALIEEIKTLNIAKIQSMVSLLIETTKTEVVVLENLLKRGQISITDFFEARRKLVEEQAAEEIKSLKRLAELETDAIKRLQLKNEILRKEQEYKRTSLILSQQQVEAENLLAQKKIEVEQMLGGMRREAAPEMEIGIDMGFVEEDVALETKHAEELNKLREFNATKEEIDEAYRLHKLQKDKLVADQEDRLLKMRLSVTKDVASGMTDAFIALYEVTGKKQKEFFILAKAASAAQTLISTYEGAMAAYKALAGIPYVGPVLGAAAAAVVTAAGMAKVAMIKSQTLAAGGEVQGHSPNDSSDNIPIWATAKEFMQPVSAVKYYGKNFMEAIRKRAIPKEIFQNLTMPIAPTILPSYAYATGGSVSSPSKSKVLSEERQQEITIVNVTDAREIDMYLASASGQDAILNVLSSRSQAVQRILR